MKRMKYILSLAIGVAIAAGMTAEDKKFEEARIYVNPGHGGWGANDRNIQAIDHALGDTTGFYETNTDLRKGLQLYHDLKDNGAAKVMISRTKNGVDEDKTIDGVPQIVNLSAICEDVEANNIDYFISIHSNAASTATTNYPLVLYRGTDDAPGNGLTDARNMGLAAWPYINSNEITFKSHYTKPTDNNTRGDISFYGSSTTTMGYTGYLGVLRHGADGYLSEGCFHTYPPERQRLLNVDYCRQEGMRYARAIRAWFNGPQETTGDIMGTVKNAGGPLEHPLYAYKAASIDAYAPLNGATVVLRNASGAEVARYTTDNEYNGVFVFWNIAPGKYTLDFTEMTDFHPYTEEIEVTANATVYTNVKLTDINETPPDDDAEAPEVTYYTHPEQDGDITAGSAYEFTAGETVTVGALESLTVRRAILRDGKYYILAHDAERAPHLLVVNPEDGSLVKEMSLEGLVTTGFGDKKPQWTLSDIAFTNDGVLVGTNSVVIGRDGNGYCSGDFYMYAWKGDGATPLEDAKPTVVLTLPTNNTGSIGQAGNNYSNLMANSIAIDGNFNDFNFYFDSHAGDGWTTTYGLRYVRWAMKDGAVSESVWNDANPAYDESMFGEDAMMTLSPLGLNRLIVDGSKITPKEFEVDVLATDALDKPEFSDKEIAVETSGANYFRYAKHIFMVSPTYDPASHSYGLNLYDITDGLDQAKKLSQKDGLIQGDALLPMYAYGTVRNAEIDLYLMVGNKTVKISTEGTDQPSATLRVAAYGLTTEKTGDESYTLSFSTNQAVETASVTLFNKYTEAEALTVAATPTDDSRTHFTATVAKADLEENTAYNWKATVSADNVTRFSAVSTLGSFYAPYGIAIDNNPESDYFGNIYVSTTEADTQNQSEYGKVGIYTMTCDGTVVDRADISGGIGWAGKGPFRIAVAADGRIFATDNSAGNAGIYVFDPATMAGAPLFKGSTNDGTGKLTIGGTYVGGRFNGIGLRGEGESTQLFAVDATQSGASWKKFVSRYDIGEASEWTTAPSESKVSGSYLGNDNNSIVPVSTGYWAAQYRGAGSSSTANPCLLYYSDKQGDVVYDSSASDTQSSQNGALAVDEKTGTVAHSYGGGVRVFRYKLDREGKPVMTLLFQAPLAEMGDYANSFAFDYAGNLYAVSSSGKVGHIYAMPTDDNTVTVLARKADVILFGEDSVDEIEAASVSVYPNPASDMATVESDMPIHEVAVYSASSGAEVIRMAGNGQTAMTIDVTGLAKGVYVVRVNGIHTMKLIKR